MTAHVLSELLQYVRSRSPFYRELYRNLSPDESDITRVPIIDQESFWRANSNRENRVLTGSLTAGIVFKSGGTTGQPKYSVFTNDEWNRFTDVFGRGMARNGLEPGEAVANLFYSGQLYASFLFIGKSLEKAGVGVHVPISGGAPIEEIISFLKQFRIGTLAGVPTTILGLADYVQRKRLLDLAVTKILFGGESMYPDQRETIRRVFPGCRIQSVGYASVDGGEIGYADPSCEIDEHRAFDETTILEIVDEPTGERIDECNRPGRILITNLERRLMPVIRYPVGDRGLWVEPPGTPDRKYRILGRTEEGARIGPMTLYIQDILNVLARFRDMATINNFQIVIDHLDLLDQATLRIAVADPQTIPQALTDDVVASLYEERHMFPDLLRRRLVHPLRVEWIREEQIIVNHRTGKVQRVIDRRFGQ
jgi:phenylacetate-CoA ligase